MRNTTYRIADGYLETIKRCARERRVKRAKTASASEHIRNSNTANGPKDAQP